MKREQLKKLIKPIIKECIHEVIMESGVLTKVVTEVANGLNVSRGTQHIMSEQPEIAPEPNYNQEAIELQKARLNEHRHKLSSAMGGKAYENIFEGVEPMRVSHEGTANEASALAGVSPRDPGVDISGIMAIGGKSWKTLARGKKR